MNINKYILENPSVDISTGAEKCGISYDAYRKRYKTVHGHSFTAVKPGTSVLADIERGKEIRDRANDKEKLKESARIIEEQQSLIDAVKILPEVTFYELPTKKSKASEATAVVLASDWHYEEDVRGDAVDGLNEFDRKIGTVRIHNFFNNVARLVNAKQKSIEVKNLVFALLGDFITGNIHEEIDTNLDPGEALLEVASHIGSGIRYLLKNTNVNITVPCHSGNHGRATRTVHQGNEHANSFEYLMYHFLGGEFKDEKRVKFVIAKGYHSYLDIAGFKIRFHHGHNLKYNGGVGGIFIPTRKAIAQWNKARPVELDCFGHFHQLLYGGNFVCNGCLIGYNAFALSIKADYEKPKQAFFLVNHDRKEVTDFSPVWLD
jgi:hypothetical protein